jgi:uncharacterized Zn-binding protein involved in type VI secretion
MPPAARTGDETSHAGTIATAPPTSAVAVETVLIGGRPVAVVGSLHVCPLHAELGPANVIIPSPGATTAGVVLFGGLPAARVGDKTACAANIVTGALTVLIGGA